MPGFLEDLIRGALTRPDTGPRTPDLTRGFREGANFPATVVALAQANLQGNPVTETPEGALVVEGGNRAGGDGSTLGDAVTVDQNLHPAVQDAVFEHELGHVDQGKLAPIVFPAVAAADSIQNLLRGGEHQDALFEGGLDNPYARGKAIQQQSLQDTLSAADALGVRGKANPFSTASNFLGDLLGRNFPGVFGDQ